MRIIKSLKAHQEWILAVAGLLLFGILLSFAIWSVGEISVDLAKSIADPGENVGKIDFQIEHLKSLNLRGFTQ